MRGNVNRDCEHVSVTILLFTRRCRPAACAHAVHALRLRECVGVCNARDCVCERGCRGARAASRSPAAHDHSTHSHTPKDAEGMPVRCGWLVSVSVALAGRSTIHNGTSADGTVRTANGSNRGSRGQRSALSLSTPPDPDDSDTDDTDWKVW